MRVVLLVQTQRAKRHPQRVEQQQPSDERLADAGQQLDRLRRLNRSDDAGQHAEDAAFRARRHEVRRRRLGIEAAIARPSVARKHGGLAFEAEDRAVDVRLAEEHAGIVDEIARGKLSVPSRTTSYLLDDVERVLRGQRRAVRLDGDVGIEIRSRARAASSFGRPTSDVPYSTWR